MRADGCGVGSPAPLPFRGSPGGMRPSEGSVDELVFVYPVGIECVAGFLPIYIGISPAICDNLAAGRLSGSGSLEGSSCSASR
jgi:hypothetical protein